VALSTRRGTVQLSIRAALAASASVGVAHLLDLPLPMYAMIAAIVVSDLSPERTRRQSLSRIAGTIVGAAVGGAATAWLPPGAASVALAVMLSLSACFLLRVGGGAKISGIVSGLIVLEFSSDPWSFALARLIETLLGVVAAIVVSFVPMLIPVGPKQADENPPAQ
jgi:uncharacterized membrane protein YgaE (UPF0421/DUF939 family)